jgi:hypothetical protein
LEVYPFAQFPYTKPEIGPVTTIQAAWKHVQSSYNDYQLLLKNDAVNANLIHETCWDHAENYLREHPDTSQQEEDEDDRPYFGGWK